MAVTLLRFDCAYWMFGIEWSRKLEERRKPRKITANRSWEIIRYEIEIQFRMHDKKNKGYLVGYLITKNTQKNLHLHQPVMKDDYIIQPQDMFVVYRYPTPYYLKSYSPVSKTNELKSQNYETMSEEAKLAAIMQVAQDYVTKKKSVHPSKYHKKFPPWFNCQICGRKGHDKLLCTETAHDDWTNIVGAGSKFQKTTAGIPMSFLQLATSDQIETGISMLNKTDEKHYVYSKKRVNLIDSF